MSGDRDWETTYRRWIARFPEGKDEFEANPSVPYEPLFTPDDVDADFEKKIGYPGEHAYTWEPYTTMYRTRHWIRRNIVYFRTVEATNKRVRRNIEERIQHGISYGGDDATSHGFDTADVDRDLVERTGAMIDSLEDHRIAMAGIPIDENTCALGDVSTYEPVAMHFALAEERDVAVEDLAGTTMHSNYLKKLVGARIITRFPQEAHKRLVRDHLEFVLENVPRWNPIGLTG